MSWQDRDYNREESSASAGPRFSFGSGMGMTPVVLWLLILNIAIFLVDMVMGHWMRLRTQWTPYALGAFSIDRAIFHGQVWRFITYEFLHSGPGHVLFNMITLYFFGPIMEQHWRGRKFLAFYLLCGLVGAAVYTAMAFGGVLGVSQAADSSATPSTASRTARTTGSTSWCKTRK